MSSEAAGKKQFPTLSRRGFGAAALPYLVLTPLLAPRGLNFVVPLYKQSMAAWSAVVLLYIVVRLLLRLRSDRKVPSFLIAPLVYFVLAVAVTLFSEKGISRGLQELFLFPVVFVFVATLYDVEFKRYVKSAAVLLSVLFAGQLLFWVAGLGISFHVTFLGHIQVFSQYGLLAFFLGALLLFKYGQCRVLSITLFVLTAICMSIVDADSSRFSLVIVIAVIGLLKLFPMLLALDFRLIVAVAILFSILLMYFTVSGCGPLAAMGLKLDFNGRLYVWESAYEIFLRSPMFGYGIGNPVIVTFWSAGMDYAHNQIMQCLVDGGVVLFSAMVWWLLTIGECVNKICDEFIHAASVAVLCALLFVMVFDAFTLYGYVFVLLALIAREGLFSEGEESSGI